ncbi:hypothetical protein SESBI_22392 [Sesbania bispinosa]|nr:hypothetical protein SESBI_22392 [Sesbania bispinosa]
MVTRRNPDRADGHVGNGEETSETTPETDNPVLQRILRRMDQSNSEGASILKTSKEQGHVYQQYERTKRGYDHRGRNFPAKKEWVDHQRSEPVGNYGLAAITPLNTTRDRILKEVYQSDLIRLPPQAEGPKGPDMSKWCDYHRAKGHDTEDCWTLTNRIERLIKESYLGRYVEKRRDRGDKDRRRDEKGSRSKRRRDDRHKEGRGKEEVRGVVTTIAGGFTGGGETSSARRRYARQSSTPGKTSSRGDHNQLKN